MFNYINIKRYNKKGMIKMFKKCLKCNEVIYVVNGKSNITCCNTEMKELIPNSIDAAFEKHVPNIEVIDNKIRVSVNHVMESDHYIEWIAQETDNEIILKKLKPNNNPVVKFDNIENSKIYSYCNKHGLWVKKISEKKSKLI